MEKRNITKEEAVDYLNNREWLDRKPLIKKIIDWKECYKCIWCYEFKTVDNFWKESHRCIDCSKKIKKEYHELNRERRRKQSEERHKNNKDRESQYYKDNKDIICERIKAYNKKMWEKYWYNFEYFHIKTRNYAKKNNIVFDKCFICNEESKIQLHHPSYETKDMWEFVVPVCSKCHNNIHWWFVDCPSPIKLTDLAKEIKTNDLWRDNKKV